MKNTQTMKIIALSVMILATSCAHNSSLLDQPIAKHTPAQLNQKLIQRKLAATDSKYTRSQIAVALINDFQSQLAPGAKPFPISRMQFLTDKEIILGVNDIMYTFSAAPQKMPAGFAGVPGYTFEEISQGAIRSKLPTMTADKVLKELQGKEIEMGFEVVKQGRKRILRFTGGTPAVTTPTTATCPADYNVKYSCNRNITSNYKQFEKLYICQQKSFGTANDLVCKDGDITGLSNCESESMAKASLIVSTQNTANTQYDVKGYALQKFNGESFQDMYGFEDSNKNKWIAAYDPSAKEMQLIKVGVDQDDNLSCQ